VTTDAGGVIQEGDEPGLDGDAFVLEVRPDQGVGLPHVVGVRFGESQAEFVRALRVGLEQFILLDDPAKGVGSNLRAGQAAGLDAQPIEQRQGGRLPVGFGPDLTEGLLHVFESDLAGLALVGTGLVLHDRDAVLLEAGVPGLDRPLVNWPGCPSSLVKVIWLTAWMRAWMELPEAMSMAPSTRIFR
jgi:hypothetical protein